jgi:hypothetical protein
VQLATIVEKMPGVTEEGLALTVHTGLGAGTTVTVKLVGVPVPPALTPATV